MKRTPLKRKTPLKRGSPIKRGAPPIQRRKPIKQMSDKRRKEIVSYSKLRKEFLLAHPKCGCCMKAQSTEVHHRARRGKHYLNTATWMAICNPCHLKVESEGNWARPNGFLLTPEQRRLLDTHALPR